MSSFIDYWCPRWEGEKNTLPKSELYEKYLQDSDIFLYCGHGDGSQYMNGGVERLSGIKSVAILSGCGSVSLRPTGTRLLPVPTHSYFHIATWYHYINIVMRNMFCIALITITSFLQSVCNRNVVGSDRFGNRQSHVYVD